MSEITVCLNGKRKSIHKGATNNQTPPKLRETPEMQRDSPSSFSGTSGMSIGIWNKAAQVVTAEIQRRNYKILVILATVHYLLMVHKLTYLLSSLEGLAFKTLEGLEVTEENYENATVKTST